jgi:hypothetical protein
MTTSPMNPLTRQCLPIAGALLALMAFPAPAVTAEHSIDVAARLRAIHVDQEVTHGKAGSALLRVSLESTWHEHIDSLVQLDHIATFFRDNHSDGVRNPDRPLIPGPPGTDINQAFIRYRPGPATISLGRQRIEYDNQRFVGSDNYWQREQTFDSLSTEFLFSSTSRIHYAYIANAKRIFGDRTLPDTDYTLPSFNHLPPELLADHRHDTHLLRLEWNEWDYQQLVFYSYLIDNRDLSEWSNDTMGLRYRYSRRAATLRYRLEAEIARQKLTKVPGNPEPDYRMLEIGLGRGSVEVLARHEVLGADDGSGFITPLGSVYRFQGLAGVFSYTPANGVVDNSLGFTWRAHPWRIDTTWHHFRSDAGDRRYGRELDIDVNYQLTRQHRLQLRYAHFRSASPYLNDQQILALDYSYNF